MDQEELNTSTEPFISSKGAPDRDPHRINTYLQVGFEEVVGEPADVRSWDRVWVASGVLFELVRLTAYRALSGLLAIPMALLAGLSFALLTCAHVWVVMPVVRSCLVVVPSMRTVWNSLVDTFVTPLSTSAGKLLSGVDVKVVST